MGTKELIETGVTRFLEEVPALKQLKIVMQIELKAKGDTQTWKVELPSTVASKDIADHAMVEVTVPRPQFNTLATDGTLRQWREAYEHGDVKVVGQGAIIKLVGNVIERHEARGRLKKVRK